MKINDWKFKIIFMLVILCFLILPNSINSQRDEMGNKGICFSNNTWIVDDEGDGHYIKIQDAIDYAENNDTIEVYSGNYQRIEINRLNNLKIIGKNEEWPSDGFYHPYPVIDANGQAHVIEAFYSDNLEIDGFKIINSSKNGQYAGIHLRDCKGAILSNNNLSNNQYGLILDYSDNSVIKYNTIWKNMCSGISIDESNGIQIINNYIIHNNWNGIITDKVTKISISSNNICNNGKNGIKLYQNGISMKFIFNIFKRSTIVTNNIEENNESCEDFFTFSDWSNNYWGSEIEIMLFFFNWDRNPSNSRYEIPRGKCP